MLGTPEQPVFERGVQVLKPVGSGCGRIDRAEEGVGRAKRHREIRGNTLGKICGHVALPDRRNVAGLETVNSRKGQFVVHAGIIDGERCRKEPVADDFGPAAAGRAFYAIGGERTSRTVIPFDGSIRFREGRCQWQTKSCRSSGSQTR